MGFFGNQVLKDRKQNVGAVQAGVGITLQEHGHYQGGMRQTETRGRAGFQVKASWLPGGRERMEKSGVPRSPPEGDGNRGARASQGCVVAGQRGRCKAEAGSGRGQLQRDGASGRRGLSSAGGACEVMGSLGAEGASWKTWDE